MIKFAKKAAFVLSCSALLAQSVYAQAPKTITATNWMAPVHVLNNENYQKWAEDVKEQSEGKLLIEVHSSGSLLPARSTMQGIRDQVADVGLVYPGYSPSEFPLNNVLNDLLFVADDDFASAFAYTELALKDPALNEEWTKNGGVFLGGYSTPVYNFACVKPVREVADAEGLKIRTAGGAQSEWVRALGAVPVSVPSPDIYSGLERGSIDCTLTDPSNLGTSFKFWEVAKSVTLLPMGVVLGANYIYGANQWKELTSEERRLLLDTLAMGMARSQVEYSRQVILSLQGSEERGLEMIKPDADSDLVKRLAEFNEQLIASLPQKSMDERNIADPSEMIQEFLVLSDTWKERLANVDRTDVNAVYELIQEHLYSQLDENTYGI